MHYVCKYNDGIVCNGGKCFSCGWNPKKNENPYWERICRLSEKQRAKGMETYGQGLESNPAAIMERINHLEEELIDSLYYLEWIKEWLHEHD